MMSVSDCNFGLHDIPDVLRVLEAWRSFGVVRLYVQGAESWDFSATARSASKDLLSLR